MSSQADPYYNRKPVPDEFIEHVGFTGLDRAAEEQSRERKYSVQGADVRKMGDSTTKGWHPTADPYYGRKPVPDYLIAGVGDTGLSKEEEYLNRERKYSVNGVDVRKFGSSSSGGFHPSDDPYYGRKQVNKVGIEGVGETGMSRAEEYESHESKASMFDLSSDPFQMITGKGHRASVSAAAGPVAAEARRRSSAVAPDHAHAAAAATAAHGHNSGYTGSSSLPPIAAGADEDRIRSSTDAVGHSTTTTTTTTTTTNVGSGTANDGQAHFYHEAITDPDSIAPHEKA